MIIWTDSQMPKNIMNYNAKGKIRAEKAKEKRIGFMIIYRRKAGIRNCGIEA
jgi:hypothetical protein